MKLKMGKKAKNQYLLSGMLAILFLLLIVFLQFVDVEAIGPEETKIGLSHLNGGFHKLFDYNVIWYTVSKIAGYFMFAVPVFFMLFALIQLISRKSVTLVDRPLLALGGLYAATAAIYVFFEVVIVNYRPVIIPGDEHVEASFPSSHTMMACVVLCSAFMMFEKYIHKEAVQVALQVACVALLVVIVIGRLLSGVHWLTDIVGGILISSALLTAFVPTAKRRRIRKKPAEELVLKIVPAPGQEPESIPEMIPTPEAAPAAPAVTEQEVPPEITPEPEVEPEQ